MNSRQNKELIKFLSIKSGISEAQGLDIVKSEFRVLKETIESYSLENKVLKSIRLPKFGLFFVKTNKRGDEVQDKENGSKVSNNEG